MDVPALIAFDLDGTLWYPEMYMLNGGAPFRRDKNGNVFDSGGTRLELMGTSADILKAFATDPKWENTAVAYVSKTEYPEWAIPALKTIIISDSWGDSAKGRQGGKGPVSMWDLCNGIQEIYPGSKLTHFKAIKNKTNIEFEDMVFYDNENWNIRECSKLGITCVYTPDGMTAKTWKDGLDRYTALLKATS
eukprot:gene21435-28400_t